MLCFYYAIDYVMLRYYVVYTSRDTNITSRDDVTPLYLPRDYERCIQDTDVLGTVTLIKIERPLVTPTDTEVYDVCDNNNNNSCV